jgi:hypothetical protein
MVAFVASLLLLMNPFYLFWGTAQYADILLSFYLLASLLSFVLTLKDPRFALITGGLAGFMSFTKNEGLALAFLLIVLWALGTVKSFSKNTFLKLIFGFVITGAATFVCKIGLPMNQDIFSDFSLVRMQFLNWQGFTLIVNELFLQITQKQWAFIWIFVLGLIILSNKKLLKDECKLLSLFFLLYAMILVAVFFTTTNFDLTWRLKSTLPRICFYMLPSVLFFIFYSLWKDA